MRCIRSRSSGLSPVGLDRLTIRVNLILRVVLAVCTAARIYFTTNGTAVDFEDLLPRIV